MKRSTTSLSPSVGALMGIGSERVTSRQDARLSAVLRERGGADGEEGDE